MSLAVVIKGTEGVVLAADSRITLQAQRSRGGPVLAINYDNAAKLLSFSKPHDFIGVVTYGMAVIGRRTAYSYIPEFELTMKHKTRVKVLTFANQLSKFFQERWADIMPADYKGPNMVFVVAGYDVGSAYGSVYLFVIPGKPKPVQRNPDNFGMTWGGQLEIVSRIIQGFDPNLPKIMMDALKLSQQEVDRVINTLKRNLEFPIPYDVLPLQDCIDLATFMIRSTIIAQGLAIGVRGVGGPIDVAIIRRVEKLKFIQEKIVHGESDQLAGGTK